MTRDEIMALEGRELDAAIAERGFVLRDPVLFDAPIPAKGKLGFWEWEEG